ncbi:alpha-2-macroglobulin family protein [Sandaracinus amylolyticus]|uniref:alpha-2-macroglobulin family protein n=1 Tax=Sandaracinus amylolyticus TaxID=927083 RepID=UPI00146FE4AE|nr:alpha-2-macroglobulin family protein [Sandaracinus amylolyticus]
MRRWSALGVVLVIALGTGAPARGVDLTTSLPIPLPNRPFLLVDAPRRFLPSESAEVNVDLAEEGTVGVAVLRVHDPVALLAMSPSRQGISVAPTALGRESEALMAQSGPLPRRGTALTLIATRDEPLRIRRGRGRVASAGESAVYDSYEGEESDVETYGVHAGAWATGSIALGRLPEGLYLVRVTRGAWAGSTLVSVGRDVLLVRRGDLHDEVRVIGADGAPRANVRVEARVGASVIAAGVTNAQGALRVPASDRERLRFVAREGEDVTWADVAHARMAACDPRVFLGTGRPVFRAGDVIHVRGQVRGCDTRGEERPLADEPLVLAPGDVTVRSDANGDFVAELIAPADGILRARVRGHESVRDVTIDPRRLPDRALTVRVDRAYAASGERVAVEVADADGGWPRVAQVSLRTPVGTMSSEIGPSRPARFSFVMPRRDEVLARVSLEATLAQPGRVQTAHAELWTGRRAEIVELSSDRSHGQENARMPVRVRASDLAGNARPGAIVVSLHGSDGNARGPERARWDVQAGEDGWATLDVELRGGGPWWIEARRGESVASLVVRNRPGPPQLGTRGELAVQPRAEIVEPGGTLEVDVRMRAGASAWVTLEQGSVHASRLVRGSQRVTLDVPREARGMATVVATEVRGAEVKSASATVEVRTSRRFAMSTATERRSYAEGERAQVTIEARDHAGAPRDAVVSVWMADAGWWELGDERHPAPDDYFRIAGRPASAGDGSAPVVYGAEEGRHVDAWMEWNGTRVERASFRHGWGFGGALVAMERSGSLRDVVQALAQAAGLRGAEVCERANARHEPVSVRAQQLPWDLIAMRTHELASVQLDGEEALGEPYVQGGVLHFECGGGTGVSGAGASGSGSGYGSGTGGMGMRGGAREERLEGTLFFLGRLALGADGREVIEIPLPAHPGRWRIEALAIADDGGGASASAVVHTTRPVVATIQAPRRLAVGDESELRIDVLAPSAAGATVEIAIASGGELVIEGEARSVAIDARGHGSLPLRVRAVREGRSSVTVRAAVASGADDEVRTDVEVAPSATSQPVAMRAVIGPDATDVMIPVPPRVRDAVLRVRVGSDVAAMVRERLEVLHAPQWQVPVLRADRLGALLALARASDDDAVVRAVRGEAAALIASAEADAGGDGSLSWWAGIARDDVMTAELVWGLAPWRDDAALRAGWVRAAEALRTRMDAGEIDAREAAAVAAALARAGDRDRARRLLSDAALDHPDALVWAVRAARAAGDSASPYGARLEPIVDAMLTSRATGGTCFTGFLCTARQSERATMARAAEALIESGRPGARERAARIAMRIAERPADVGAWTWGDADADVLALIARLEDGHADDVVATVVQGERRLARVRGDASVVVPAGDEPIALRFEGGRGRFVLASIDGVVDVDATRAGRGNVPVERRFVSERGGQFVEIELTLRRDARDVALSVPLPAGLELGRATVGVSATGRRFTWWGAEVDAGPEVPRLARDASGLALRWERLRAGRYVVRVPLVQSARGRFTAGAVLLRTADDTTWGLAPPLVLE